jgi:hypothetical protein
MNIIDKYNIINLITKFSNFFDISFGDVVNSEYFIKNNFLMFNQSLYYMHNNKSTIFNNFCLKS